MLPCKFSIFLAVSHLVVSMFNSVLHHFQALHRLATSKAQWAQGSLGSQEEPFLHSSHLGDTEMIDGFALEESSPDEQWICQRLSQSE